MSKAQQSLMVVLSGPSGAGKSTLCQRLLANEPNLAFSVSCTTRPPRRGEVPGRDYHFLSRAEFEARIAAGAFLEHAEVHGQFYGTPRQELMARLDAGGDVLLDIDVQGGRLVRTACQRTPDLAAHALFIFLGPPGTSELEARLRGRATDAEAVINRRLAQARHELAAWREYDYLVVNDDLERAEGDLRAIFRAERLRTSRRLAPWDAA